MVKKYCSVIFLLLLISNVSIGQKEDGYVTTKLTKRIKKMVCDQEYEEAYQIVLQNKESLGHYFVDKFSSAYQSSNWIDTVSIDSTQLFEGKDKLACIGIFSANEYTTEGKGKDKKRVLVIKGSPKIYPVLIFGHFVKLSSEEIRKVKRNLKRKGWYKGKINEIWDAYARRQLVYFSIFNPKSHGYPINLHDKYEVHNFNLHSILNYKPLPKKIAKRVGYKNARSVEKIKISTFNNSENSYKNITITERKNIRHFIRLLSRLKKVKKLEQKKDNIVINSWQVYVHYRDKDRQKTEEIYILKSSKGDFVSVKGALYHSSEELIKFINQL